MGLFGGGGGGGSTNVNNVAGASQYVPTGQSTADQTYQSILQSLAGGTNYPAQNLPAITGYTNQLETNPYQTGAQTGANTAGTILSNLSGVDTGNAAAIQPYVSETLNTAFDPQNELYNSEVQKLTDQINATNSMYGLGSSPVGASILGDQLGNFNIDWANNQLNREIAGTGAAGTLSGDINSLDTAGASAAQTGGAVPSSNYSGNINNILSALSNLSSAGIQTDVMPNSIMNYLQSYLGLGQTANANEANANQMGYQNLAQLGQSIAGIGSIGNSIFGGSAAPAASIALPSYASSFYPGMDLSGLPAGDISNYGAAYAADSTASDFAAPAASSGGFFSGLGDSIMSLFT